MPAAFVRTQRALAKDGFRGPALVIVTLTLLAGLWVTWLLGARISVHALTSEARLEARRTPVELQSQVEGRLIEAERQVVDATSSSGRSSVREARARARQASAAARLAVQIAERAATLGAGGVISSDEKSRLASLAEQGRESESAGRSATARAQSGTAVQLDILYRRGAYGWLGKA